MLNIMNPPADWSTMKKLIWLRGTPINGGEDLTVTGTPPLTLPNSLGKPLKAWSVDLLPYQEGTGDPSPSNVRPIHGTDKVNITTAGKNLCDTANLVRGTYNIGGIPNILQPNTTYTYSLSGTDTECKYRLFTGNSGSSSAIRALSMTYIGCGQSDTFTTPSDLTEAGLVLAGNNSTAGAVAIDDLLPQIEFGSTATAYTPYISPSQTVLTLPQTVYTATISEQGGESRWGEVDLGTLTWTNYSSGVFYTLITGRKYSFNNIICSSYATSSVAGAANLTDMHIVGAMSDTAVYVKNTNFTTDTAAFQAAMNGVQLVYELATPATLSVPSVTIPTPTGTVTAWATAEDGTVESMKVTYVGKA